MVTSDKIIYPYFVARLTTFGVLCPHFFVLMAWSLTQQKAKWDSCCLALLRSVTAGKKICLVRWR